MRLKPGQHAPEFAVSDHLGKAITLRDLAGKKSMIAFFRHAGCPFCNLRVAELIREYPALQNEGLQIVSFWQSTAEQLYDGAGSQKPQFPMIPDRHKEIYRHYGIENSRLALFKMLLQPSLTMSAIRSPYRKKHITGESDLVPADFLINEDLTIHTAYYGSDVGDHIPLSQVRAFLAG